MKRQLCTLVLVAVTLCLLATQGLGKNSSEIIKQHERNTISLELEFTKKNPNALQRVISFLNWGPNGYATGFVVGEHLVMTAYHVVSGELDESKKLALGFARTDKLEARVYTNGCQAKILGVDVNADLALLEVCGTPKQTASPSFQLTLNKDEKLMLIVPGHTATRLSATAPSMAPIA
jgi:S1-C subfamily serine protease